MDPFEDESSIFDGTINEKLLRQIRFLSGKDEQRQPPGQSRLLDYRDVTAIIRNRILLTL